MSASAAIRWGLAGRVVVVTGAAQGIGAACVRRLVEDGASVALWDLAEAEAAALAQPLAAQGARGVG